MRDYKAATSDVLLALVNSAISEGPSAVLSLACALEEYAHKVRLTRDGMSCSPQLHCSDCGRYWTASMTVARERQGVPDNCPPCYAASGAGRVSGYVHTFRYIDGHK